MSNDVFRTDIARTIFANKYKHEGAETWQELSNTLVEDVCGDVLQKEDIQELTRIHGQMQFIAGGRYLYYAGRPNKFFNNCFLIKAEEDSREDWANLSWKSESCLMTGGGIGIDYSVYRPEGSPINKTGGYASGPIPKMQMINEIGRRVMQGGSRRSAIYASLNWRHADADKFLKAKDWHNMTIKGAFDADGNPLTVAKAKEYDFDYPAPLDMTNVSLNYDNAFLNHIYGDHAYGYWKSKIQPAGITGKLPETFIQNVRQALMTGEPGFSFNYFDQERETLRNACTEVVSEDDSDVCNLGSINMSRISDIETFRKAVRLGSMFLLCGTLKADLPYDKIKKVREKNRRLGLGLMGVHEWLLQRGYRYEMNDELRQWMQVYKEESEKAATELAIKLGISVPVAFRAIAPTGTIGMIASTTTGIEPLFAVAYKRRYLSGKTWKYQYVIDGTAKTLIDMYGVDPDSIESAIDLEKDYERRIKFQADIQDYVDMSISSTINLSEWGSKHNNEDTVLKFAETLAKYAHRLRGFTCYPSGARGGQPLTSVDYKTALESQGLEFIEHDICDITGHGGSCGV